MATLEKPNGKLISFLKKTATILTTAGFFVAAVFLVVALWAPANAAPLNTGTDVQLTLLLTLDQPRPPASKMHLPPMPSPADKEGGVRIARVPSDLVTELNNWTYTQSSGGNIFSLFDRFVRSFFASEITLVRDEIILWRDVLRAVGLPGLGDTYLETITLLDQAVASLFSPST